MEHLENSLERDELRIRFTAWLETIVKRAKIDYIRKQKKYRAEISLNEEFDFDVFAVDLQLESEETSMNFDFENVQLAAAFSKIQPKRREVLTMLFVQNLTPQEISEEFQCSIQHVYNQRSLALKELKSILNKESE